MVRYELRKGENIHMGLTSKPVGKMKSIIRKLENHLVEESKLQKDKKESEKDNEYRRKSI